MSLIIICCRHKQELKQLEVQYDYSFKIRTRALIRNEWGGWDLNRKLILNIQQKMQRLQDAFMFTEEVLSS